MESQAALITDFSIVNNLGGPDDQNVNAIVVASKDSKTYSGNCSTSTMMLKVVLPMATREKPARSSQGYQTAWIDAALNSI